MADSRYSVSPTDEFPSIEEKQDSENEKKISESEEEEHFSPEDGSSYKDKTKQNGFMGKVINVLSVITIVQLITLVTTTTIWHVKRKEELAPREHEICLNCSDLTDKPTDSDVLDAYTKRDGSCCGTTSQILNALVEKNTREKYAKDLSNNFFTYAGEECSDQIPEKAAAKVAGISFIKTAQDTSPMNIIHWNETDPNSFFKSGLNYTDGRFTILEPGFYYIFNQLKWTVNDTDLDPLVHEINKLGYMQDDHEVLLQGTKSKCNMLEESGESTSSVGAVFELNRNDQLFVTTSRPGCLVPCHHGNFFGLYLVADKRPGDSHL